MNPIFPLESSVKNYSLGEALYPKEDLKDNSLLKIFEDKIFNDFTSSSAPIKWTAEQVLIVKNQEQEQFKHLIEFIINSLDSEKYKEEIGSLKNLSEGLNTPLKGVNVLDLKSSVSQKKEIILSIIKNLSSEDLDSLQNTYLSDSILLKKIFKEAKYIKQLEHINLTCSGSFTKKQKISPILQSIRQTEEVSFLLQCVDRLPNDLKLNYLYEICRPYSDDISVPLGKNSLIERDVVAALTSSSFDQKEVDQVLVVLSQFLINKGQINRALTILYMLSDTELRTHLLQTSIDLTSLHQQFPTEKALMEKALSLYGLKNNQVNLIIKLMKESPHSENENILAILIKSEMNDPTYTLLLQQICHQVLKNTHPELSTTLEGVVFIAWLELSSLLEACSKDARSDLIQLISLMPQSGKDTNLPILLYPSGDQFKSFETKRRDEILIIKELFRNISNEKIIKEVLGLVRDTPLDERLNLLKTINSFLEGIESKEETFISLLKIPVQFWPTPEQLKGVLNKKQLFTDIANSIGHEEQNNLSTTVNLLLKSSKMGENTWHHYVVRNKNFEIRAEYNITSDNDNQKNYGRLMHQATWATTHYIIKENATFTQTFDFVCLQRRLIAKKLSHVLDHIQRGEFGRTRTSEFNTDCVAPYEELGQDLKKINRMLLNGQIQSNNVTRIVGYEPQETMMSKLKKTLTSFQNNSGDNQVEPNFTFEKTAVIDTERVELSKIEYSLKQVRIYHTSTANIQKIMSHLDKLYTDLLNMEIKSTEDKVRALEMSGEFYWWFCECKPVERGDPSIAEMMLRAVWNLKGLDSPPWKKGIIPWAEVVKALDIDEFAKNFHTLLEND